MVGLCFAEISYSFLGVFFGLTFTFWMSRIVGRLNPELTQFFVCDLQERFRSLIVGFPSILEGSRRLVEAAKILSIPTVVTEQVLISYYYIFLLFYAYYFMLIIYFLFLFLFSFPIQRTNEERKASSKIKKWEISIFFF